MFALFKNLTTLRHLVAKCAVYFRPGEDIAFVNPRYHTRNEATLPNGFDLTLQNSLHNAEIQYPDPAHIAYQHQIVDRQPTLSMDEPRLSSLSYEQELMRTPTPSIFARRSFITSGSLPLSTDSPSPIRRVPLDKGVIIDIPFYGTYRLEDYKCVTFNGRPYIEIEGLRIVSPPHISVSHLLVPWDNFEISRKILGWKEWIRIHFWHITILVRCYFAGLYLRYINDEETMIGSDE